MKYSVDVLAFRVRDGEFPVYRPVGDEEWYYLDVDGRTWRTADGKTPLPEVEIVGWTAESVTRTVLRDVATIATLQEHGGTVIMFVRDFSRVFGAEVVWTFVGSMVMTAKTGKPVQDAVKLFDRTVQSVEGIPSKLEIDDFTVQHLDNAEMVEEVHDL